MEKRKVKELQIKTRDGDGNEGWISMTEFSIMLLESVGEAIDLTFKGLTKELKNQEIEEKKDSLKKYFVWICHSCKKQVTEEDMGNKCPHCEVWQYNHFAKKKQLS